MWFIIGYRNGDKPSFETFPLALLDIRSFDGDIEREAAVANVGILLPPFLC